jgi:hypothetical protein
MLTGGTSGCLDPVASSSAQHGAPTPRWAWTSANTSRHLAHRRRGPGHLRSRAQHGAEDAPSWGGAPPPAERGASGGRWPRVAFGPPATTIAARLGPQGQGLLDAARSAFLQGMGDAVQVGAGVAALAALLVLLFLPARATASTEEPS